MRAFQRLARVSLVLGLIGAFITAAPTPVGAQAVSQGYSSDSNLQKGTIVKLKDGDKTKITPLTTATIGQMQGVVVAANDAPVTLSSSNPASQQYFVATIGQYDVLVSDQNGAVKAGDYITISSIDGVGMKADGSQSVVLGKATSSFSGGSSSVSTVKIGGSTVNLGRVMVTIAISHNPWATTTPSNVPGLLKHAGTLITNKEVNPVRLYLGLVILLASVVVAASMLYSGIRSSLIAVGRNPLAKQSITRNLIQVIVMSLVVFTIGLIAVYLILKL
jgi:hypothetical protein